MDMDELSPHKKAVFEASMKIALGRKMVEEGNAELDHLLGTMRVKSRRVTSKVKALTTRRGRKPTVSSKRWSPSKSYPEREAELLRLLKKSDGWETVNTLRRKLKWEYRIVATVLEQLKKTEQAKCVRKSGNPHHRSNSARGQSFNYWISV